MSQPVKLSDALVLETRLAGEIVERSIAGQVEFWARLGGPWICWKAGRCWPCAGMPPLARSQPAWRPSILLRDVNA